MKICSHENTYSPGEFGSLIRKTTKTLLKMGSGRDSQRSSFYYTSTLLYPWSVLVDHRTKIQKTKINQLLSSIKCKPKKGFDFAKASCRIFLLCSGKNRRWKVGRYRIGAKLQTETFRAIDGNGRTMRTVKRKTLPLNAHKRKALDELSQAYTCEKQNWLVKFQAWDCQSHLGRSRTIRDECVKQGYRYPMDCKPAIGSLLLRTRLKHGTRTGKQFLLRSA